jgi:coproporphyrinogen III oxidase
MKTMRESMQELVQDRQREICQALLLLNGGGCATHAWKSDVLEGGGVANIFDDQGQFLERGGVNVSTVRGKVFGDMLKMLAEDLQGQAERYSYFATGISLVLHPHSPYVPTVHANYRYFEIMDENQQTASWFFGGGADLTPYYLFEEDATHFHAQLKNACDKSDLTLYEKLKTDADAYFYLPHRQEHRGIGGIFSLRLCNRPQEQLHAWVADCSEAFLNAYMPIAHRRMHMPFSAKEKHWQHLRRGRYVEFNLMHDVGTQFGVKSGGHIENIFMSLPPKVAWTYNHVPEEGSEEEKLMQVIKQPRKWI